MCKGNNTASGSCQGQCSEGWVGPSDKEEGSQMKEENSYVTKWGGRNMLTGTPKSLPSFAKANEVLLPILSSELKMKLNMTLVWKLESISLSVEAWENLHRISTVLGGDAGLFLDRFTLQTPRLRADLSLCIWQSPLRQKLSPWVSLGALSTCRLHTQVKGWTASLTVWRRLSYIWWNIFELYIREHN